MNIWPIVALCSGAPSFLPPSVALRYSGAVSKEEGGNFRAGSIGVFCQYIGFLVNKI